VGGVVKIGNYFIKKNSRGNTNTNNDNTDIALLRKKTSTTQNIEKCDMLVKDNPQYLAEYVKDIFLHLKQVESINQAKFGYMSRQTDINEKMRSVLIDWVIEVKFKKYKIITYRSM
jgi:hypothetical protein